MTGTMIARLILGVLGPTWAAAVTPPASAEPVVIPPPPPGFEARRPIDPDDYRRKNERGYFTGLPLFNYDPNTGYGAGARGYYFWDGVRSDPRFGYTPYLQRVFLNLFATTGGLQFHWLDYDVPSIAGTAFRFRAQLIYDRNTDEHYFGVGARTLDPLSFPGSTARYPHFDQYQQALDAVTADGRTWSRYNRFDLTRPLLVAGVERTFFRGLLRSILGVGLNHLSIRSYGGTTQQLTGPDGTSVNAVNQPTRLDEDCAPPARIVGCGGGWDNFLRLGLSLDTRDYEPDPNRGVFIDAEVDIGTRVLGSAYEWERFLLAARGYLSPFPTKADLVLAVRGTFEVQSTDTPFFEMKVMPYTDDPHNGMGGLRTLRGFKQDRFVGPVMLLGNAELRWTFYRFELWKQKFGLFAVPFVDVGTVADHLDAVHASGMKADAGGAFRVSWNLATIITVEYAQSAEDSGFYVNFNHMF
jgi:hypothetical protein